MIDAFLCSAARDELRRAMFHLTRTRLSLEGDIRLHTIECPGGQELLFRVKRRQMAEELATTPYYLVSDDDVLPHDFGFVSRGAAILRRHPDYAMILYRCANVDLGESPEGTEEVEHRPKGVPEGSGLYLMRRGIVTEWPEQVTEADGWTHYEPKIIESKGYKVGMFRKLQFTHVGIGFSTLWYNANGYGPIK